MSFIIKFVEFLEKNWTLIKENWYIFLVFALLVVAVTSLLYKAREKKQIDKHKSELAKQKEAYEADKKRLEEVVANQKNKLEELDKTINSLQEDIKLQKECYRKLETEAWLAAPKVEPSGPAAKKMSESVRKNPKIKK